MNFGAVALGAILMVVGVGAAFGGIAQMNDATEDYILFEYVDDDAYRAGYYIMIGGFIAGILGFILLMVGLVSSDKPRQYPTTPYPAQYSQPHYPPVSYQQQQYQTMPAQPSNQPIQAQQKRYCGQCGQPISSNAVYCMRCGAKIP